MNRAAHDEAPDTAGARPGTSHPWTQSLLVLAFVTSAILVLDRVFRPNDLIQNVLLVAFVAGTIAAVVIVQPLRHVPYMARNLDAGADLDIFLACAILSWLGVRFALGLNGYPRVGGSGLHIAHMLWGGGLMLIGAVVTLLYVGRYRQRLAAIISGLGFGLFIDELGKFITSNNNYFYRPAVPLVYAVFVALYLLFRTVQQPHHVTDRENLANALDWMKEAVIRYHDPEALDRARFYLNRVEPTNVDRAVLEYTLTHTLTRPASPPDRSERLRRAAQGLYYRIILSVWFNRVAIGVVLLLVGVQVVTDVQIVRSLLGAGSTYRLPGSNDVLTLSNGTGMIVQGVAGVTGDFLLITGVLMIFRSRSLAFRLWKLGIQIIMFVAGVVSLYYFQFLALPELTVNVVALAVVNSLVVGESRCKLTELHPVWRSTGTLSGPANYSGQER